MPRAVGAPEGLTLRAPEGFARRRPFGFPEDRAGLTRAQSMEYDLKPPQPSLGWYGQGYEGCGGFRSYSMLCTRVKPALSSGKPKGRRRAKPSGARSAKPPITRPEKPPPRACRTSLSKWREAAETCGDPRSHLPHKVRDSLGVTSGARSVKPTIPRPHEP